MKKTFFTLVLLAVFTQAMVFAQSNADRELAKAHYQRGEYYRDRGNWDTAIAEYTEAIRLNPNIYNYYADRAFSYFYKGDYDHVIADFTQAIRLNPPNEDKSAFYLGCATAYFLKGNFTQARADVNSALQINPSYQEAKDVDAALKQRGY